MRHPGRTAYLSLFALLPVPGTAAVVLPAPPPVSTQAVAAEAPRPGEYPVRFARHEPASSTNAPRDADLVVGVVLGREARAYPLNLMWHESAHTLNDELAAQPIAVALCPLAGVATAFVRRDGKRALEISHLSEVERDTLVLYDKDSHSKWNLFSGEAFAGPRTGARLGHMPTLLTTWGRWKALHPGTTVYVAPEEAERGFQLDADRIRKVVRSGGGPPRRSDWVVGLQGRRESVAILVRGLAKVRVSNEEFDGAPVVVFVSSDAATTVVWKRTTGERHLTFRLAGDDQMVDDETSSLWDPLRGVATSGPLAGKALAPVPATVSFWHAWKSHHPQTRVIGQPQ